MSTQENPQGGQKAPGPRRDLLGLLAESRQEVAAQAAKIQALQEIVSTQRRNLTKRAEEIEAARATVSAWTDEVGRKDESYNALARECEEHRARAAMIAKDLARERARNGNLESALEAATKRCASLERGARDLLRERDAREGHQHSKGGLHPVSDKTNERTNERSTT